MSANTMTMTPEDNKKYVPQNEQSYPTIWSSRDSLSAAKSGTGTGVVSSSASAGAESSAGSTSSSKPKKRSRERSRERSRSRSKSPRRRSRSKERSPSLERKKEQSSWADITDKESKDKEKREVCKYYLMDKCKFGDKCRLEHRELKKEMKKCVECGKVSSIGEDHRYCDPCHTLKLKLRADRSERFGRSERSSRTRRRSRSRSTSLSSRTRGRSPSDRRERDYHVRDRSDRSNKSRRRSRSRSRSRSSRRDHDDRNHDSRHGRDDRERRRSRSRSGSRERDRDRDHHHHRRFVKIYPKSSKLCIFEGCKKYPRKGFEFCFDHKSLESAHAHVHTHAHAHATMESHDPSYDKQDKPRNERGDRHESGRNRD